MDRIVCALRVVGGVFQLMSWTGMESTTSFLLMQNALGGSVLRQELHRRHLACRRFYCMSEWLNNRESGSGHSKISWFLSTELSLSDSASSSVRVRTRLCTQRACVCFESFPSCIDFLLIK